MFSSELMDNSLYIFLLEGYIYFFICRHCCLCLTYEGPPHAKLTDGPGPKNHASRAKNRTQPSQTRQNRHKTISHTKYKLNVSIMYIWNHVRVIGGSPRSRNFLPIFVRQNATCCRLCNRYMHVQYRHMHEHRHRHNDSIARSIDNIWLDLRQMHIDLT